MAKMTKKMVADVKKAIVAYSAYHEHIYAGEVNRALIYGRMIRDVAHIFETVGLNVQPIIDRVNLADVRNRRLAG